MSTLRSSVLDAGADATITSNERRRAIDCARDNQQLKDTEVYWHLHDAGFDWSVRCPVNDRLRDTLRARRGVRRWRQVVCSDTRPGNYVA